jgi:hypothetical protein
MIVDFFREQGVAFHAVRLRRHPTSKMFKGSLFIECTTKDEADRVGDLGGHDTHIKITLSRV